MSVLHRKLARDLRRLVGQVLTIALVVAAGTAIFVGAKSAWTALSGARAAWYQETRFGHVFAALDRAPRALGARIEAIPGVRAVDLRVVEEATVLLEAQGQPPVGRLVSLPRAGRPALNDVVVSQGRWPDPDSADEVLLLGLFAQKWGLGPGSPLTVVVAGVQRPLRVVGLADSPEYVFAVAPGSIAPDPQRFAVIWAPEDALAAATGKQGAFDDVSLLLEPGASVAAVCATLDRVLAPYGGRGATGRDRQVSDIFVSQELQQLYGMAFVAPGMFLAVAGFLVHVVLSRLIALQRGEIATLKAVGYPNRAIAAHFLQLVGVVVGVGALLGLAGGAWIGALFVDLYRDYFNFPHMRWRLVPRDLAVALGVTGGAALVGAMSAVRGVVRLPPAEAMRPPSPTVWRRTWLDRLRVERVFGVAGRMVLRETSRHPLRLAFSALGIAFAVAILVVGRFSLDAIEPLIQRQFQAGFREDVAVSFARPVPLSDARALAAVPGVEHVEGLALVPARAHAGARWRDVAVLGHPRGARLRRVVDAEGRAVSVPEQGALLTEKLAEVLDVRPGDALWLEVRQGDWPTLAVRVVGTVDELLGTQIHMDQDALAALLGETPRVSMALLDIDPPLRGLALERLRALPGVVDVAVTDGLVARFRRQMDESLGAITVIMTGLASVLAVGIVYNNARVALSQRARDLASLRVLGFTRGEISAVLLGEMAVQVLLGLPLGVLLGRWMAAALASTVDPERYRLPGFVSSQTVGFALSVTLIAALLSALLVRRRLDRLDLIAVLKARE